MEWQLTELRTFLELAQAPSLAAASERLGLSPSTVTLHLQNLERRTGSKLVERSRRGTPGTSRITAAGRILLDHAHDLLDAAARADAAFDEAAPAGRVRLAIADDLTSTRLGDALREFRRRRPQVEVEVTVGQSTPLGRRLRAGQFDLALVKRHPPGDAIGLVARDRLLWIAHPDLELSREAPVPLIAYPTSSVTRIASTRALDAQRRPWRVANTVRGVNGAMTATRAGIGIAVAVRGVVPPDLVEVGPAFGLPDLGLVDIAILGIEQAGAAATELARAILRAQVYVNGGA